MELVRPADRRRGRGDEDRPADSVFLTRRTFLFKGLILGGFTALAGKLWRMQVMNARNYEAQAAGSSQRPEPLSAARGLILDRNGNILAENRVSWTVSVVPALLPDDPAQVGAIRDQLIKALDLKDMLVIRLNALPLGSRQFVVESVAREIGADPNQLVTNVLRTDHANNLVVIRQDLAPADADRLRQAQKRLPGVHVMNQFDYLMDINAGSPLPVDLKKDVDRQVALGIEANSLYLPGVKVSGDTLVRRYPAGPDFAHILGYVGPITKEEYDAAKTPSGGDPYLPTDNVGRGGLEEALEPDLRGTRGLRWMLTDALGVDVTEMENRRINPTSGLTAVLTLDRDFQKAVAAALQEGIDRANESALKGGKDPVGSGAVAAINPQNGEVLALVSLPTFDNQLFVNGISEQQYQAYLNDSFTPLVDRSISGAFPPGSTIKPFHASGALQAGTLTANTQFLCRGSIRVPVVGDEAGGNRYYCWLLSGHGWLAVEEAIGQSCDVFFYNVGAPGQIPEGSTEPLHYYIPGNPSPVAFKGMGIDKIDANLLDFGFGAPTGIELPGESPGLVPTQKWLFQTLREYWSVGDTINTSIGQGYFSCTPLQLACGLAAIANRGTYHRPRLVQRLQDTTGKVVREFPPVVSRRLSVSQNYLEMVRQGMRLTVTEPKGTAYRKFVKTGNDFPIAGKTGTAEYGAMLTMPGIYRYKKSHAWFTAFAPFDKPEIALAVLIEGGGEGATYSVPVADTVLATYFGKVPKPA